MKFLYMYAMYVGHIHLPFPVPVPVHFRFPSSIKLVPPLQ